MPKILAEHRTPFMSKVTKKVLSVENYLHTSVYYIQAEGLVKQLNKTLSCAKVVDEVGIDLDFLLPY